MIFADASARIGLGRIDYIFCTNATDRQWKVIVAAAKPEGKVGLIDDPVSFDARALKQKSISLHWEPMFARPVFSTPDTSEQHRLLDAVAQLVDQGRIRTTLAEHFGPIDAATISPTRMRTSKAGRRAAR